MYQISDSCEGYFLNMKTTLNHIQNIVIMHILLFEVYAVVHCTRAYLLLWHHNNIFRFIHNISNNFFFYQKILVNGTYKHTYGMEMDKIQTTCLSTVDGWLPALAAVANRKDFILSTTEPQWGAYDNNNVQQYTHIIGFTNTKYYI